MNSLNIHLNLDNYCLFLYIFKALDTINHRAQEKHMTFSISVLERSRVLRSCLPTRELQMAEQLKSPWYRELEKPPGALIYLGTSAHLKLNMWFYLASLRLFTVRFSVPSFGPCKDKTLTSKCVNMSFPQSCLTLKLFQSLSFLEVNHKYPRWQKAFIVQGELNIAGYLIFLPITWSPKATFKLLLLWVGDYSVWIYFEKKDVLTILQ